MTTITGLDECITALNSMAAQVEGATPRALEGGMTRLDRQARGNLIRLSHRRGTPTPSPPGQPPAKISGALRDSLTQTPPVPDGAGAWSAVLTPDIVYAAIQEFGGMAGRGHRSKIPARPYMRPAVQDLLKDSAVTDGFARAWGEALRI